MSGVWAVTGHRPDKFGGYNDATFQRIVTLAEMAVRWAQPDMLLVGMALGWDIAMAVAASRIGVPFIACVPFQGQETRWQPDQQQVYHDLLKLTAKVIFVSPPPYSAAKMEIRNRYMVDNSDGVLAAWNGDEKGGTANCIRYALSRKPVFNWWGVLRLTHRRQ